MSYSVSDCIIRIKNACNARRRSLLLANTRMNKRLCDVLVKEGFLTDCKQETVEGNKMLRVTIQRIKRVPVFTDVILYSKPSLRVYVGLRDFGGVLRGKGVVVLSTSKGIMTAREAQKKGVGGELLFKVW